MGLSLKLQSFPNNDISKVGLYKHLKTICTDERSLCHHRGIGTLKVHLSAQGSLDVRGFKGPWKASSSPWGCDNTQMTSRSQRQGLKGTC